VEAASEFGVDVTLLIEQLKLSPAERARRMHPPREIGPRREQVRPEMSRKQAGDGRHNVSRRRMIADFKRMADSVRRWYLPQEQQVGARVYQPIIGKLINLPEGPLGSAFPPAAFVEQETAMQAHPAAGIATQLVYS